MAEASDFYAAMLADVLDASARVARALDLDCALALHPASALVEVSRRLPLGIRAEAQVGRGLAERMGFAFAQALACGFRRILVRGSDSPTMGEDLVREALEALEDHDLVLSPDQGGGYGLVGLRCAAPGLFDHPMSTPQVLEDTLARADELGLRARILSPCFDLDVAADLQHLARARSRGDTRSCARVLAFADARGLWTGRRGETGVA